MPTESKKPALETVSTLLVRALAKACQEAIQVFSVLKQALAEGCKGSATLSQDRVLR